MKKVCKFLWKEKELTVKHTPEVHEEKMFNCEECSFQSTRQAILRKHKNTTHRKAHEQSNDVFRCNECEMQFSERWNLMNHKRDNHEVTEICQHYEKGTCRFMPPKRCWLLHKEKTPEETQRPKISEEVSCYVCKQNFRTRNGMMRHRIQYHIEVVPECREFMQGKCDFTGKEKACWFKHTEKGTNSSTSDFQESADNLAPPSQK